MTVTVSPRSPVNARPSWGAAAHHPVRRITDRVLLVDDEPALTNLLKMALHYEAGRSRWPRDGQEAMAKFGEFGPDLLVLDLMLPDIDGLEILKMIRRRRVTAHVDAHRPRLGDRPGHRADGRRR